MRLIGDRLLIAVFLLGLTVPAALSLVRPPDANSLAHENRRAAPAPDWSFRLSALKKLPAAVEAFFNDRLAFRERLLNWHAAVKVEQLGVSSSERVILGRDGWLFMDHQKSASPGRSGTAAEQCEVWRRAFLARHEWCAARGIYYLVVLTPEKDAVYTEFLPAALQHRGPPSAAERLIQTCGETPVQFVDLRPYLQREKMNQQVYFRTDTHWNDAGGYCAYQAITTALGLRTLPRSEFEVVHGGHVGDLNRMLHRARPAPERVDCLRLRQPRAQRFIIEVPLDSQIHSPQYLAPQAWGCAGRGPRAILLHDSFAERVLLPTLAEHFECLVYAPTASFDPALIERFPPDVVIQQIVERKINQDVPVHPRGFK